MNDEQRGRDPRAQIPSINVLCEQITAVLSQWSIPHGMQVRLARLVAAEARAGQQAVDDAMIRRTAQGILHPGPQPVINATGILLHTNLGRAPLRQATVQDALMAVAGYTDLEWDRDSGKRGHRDRHFAAMAQSVWGVEDAMLVNNAAAAVALSLSALAAGGRTVVSRGELIEIGGSFRLPDIMALSGTTLVEVGATNKTKLDDYRRALQEPTACLFKAYPSNYRIEGFTAQVDLRDLVQLGREHKTAVIMDAGSGLPADLPFPELGEPTIEDYLRAEPDVLIFSGDKLFGGVQAGLILGNRECLQRLRQHPMNRMVRCDKFTIALVCHQLRDTLLGRIHPFAALANTRPEVLRQRADRIVSACKGWPMTVVEDAAFVGGGSLPREQRPAFAVRVEVNSVEALAATLRRHEPAIVGHIHRGGLQLNMAAVFDTQVNAVIDAFQQTACT